MFIVLSTGLQFDRQFKLWSFVILNLFQNLTVFSTGGTH
jgi:hypothetical protein